MIDLYNRVHLLLFNVVYCLPLTLLLFPFPMSILLLLWTLAGSFYFILWLILLSLEKLSKDRLKLSLKRRLQDLHIQSFQNFLKGDENLRKCTIVNICTKETYSTSDYLSHINSPRIRSIFTKDRFQLL